MSIRYECEGCGSVLKIKESLAGTSGKCPHCKAKFIVPQKAADSGVGIESASDTKLEAPAPVASPKAAAAPPKLHANNGDDFDVDAFLMDDKGPGAKASAGLSAPPPAPAAPPKPMYDKQGRRTIAAPPPSPGSSAEIPAGAGDNSAVNASANARDLLSKSRDEGRAKAASLPGAPRKPLFNYDIQGSLGQLKQVGVYIVLGIVAVAGLYWLSDRMMSSRMSLPKLAPVSGTVTLNGQPLPNVIVHLTPVNPKEGKATDGKTIHLRDATGSTNPSGFYEVQYIEGISGAPLGNARVWIEPINPADFKKIPPQYASNGSTDIRDVKEAGNESRFNLELKAP